MMYIDIFHVKKVCVNNPPLTQKTGPIGVGFCSFSGMRQTFSFTGIQISEVYFSSIVPFSYFDGSS